MPPKRNAAPKRGPGRPPKNEVKASPKISNQKKAASTSKSSPKAKGQAQKLKQSALATKVATNKLTCSDCDESFSSAALLKRHQLNCGVQEKPKVTSNKRVADVEDDIEIISSKIKKSTEGIENDVEIIATCPKKSEDKIKLQAFMSNKVQYLMSSVSPVKDLELSKAIQSTSQSKPETKVSISASNLRKNIALSMQKNDLSEVSKPRRGRKPNQKNQNTNNAQKPVQSSLNKAESQSKDETVAKNSDSNVPMKTTLSKEESKYDQSASSIIKKPLYDEISIIEESAKVAAEILAVPARRGRPPKRLHDDQIKAAIEERRKKLAEMETKNVDTAKDVTIPSVEKKEKIEIIIPETSSVVKRRGRPPKKIVDESIPKDASKTTDRVQNEKELEIEMEIGSDKKEFQKKLGLEPGTVEFVDISVKEEKDTEETSSKAKDFNNKASSFTIIDEESNQDSKAQIKESTSNEESVDSPPVFSCAVCQKVFTRKYHLDRHLRISKCSGLPLPSFPCELCNRVYTRKDNLREHLRSHAGEVHRKKKHKCNYCDKAFHGQSLLAIHVRKHTGERPYSCDFCPKKFSSAGALAKHRMTHTGERPYTCNECGRRFTLKGTLSRHQRTHTGIRPHTCPYCGKKFIQIGGLNAHLFYHTGENGFKCEDCGKIFNRKARLQMHQLYVHIKLKPYACDNCPKTFTRKEDLMRHTVLHTGEKPYKCPTCDRRFSVKPSLKLHLLTHTKEEPRSCHECGRAFIRKDCLLRHMRKRHRDVFDKILFDEKDEKDPNIVNSRVLNEKDLTDNIRELLYLLIDEPTLIGFGWPDKAVDEVLELVIQRCGHTPVTRENYEYMDRLRENAKLLFTVVIDDNAVKTLLNNQTVDEVILHVLRLAKT